MPDPVTTQRIRLVVLTDEQVRQALKMAAGEEGVEQSAVADRVLREGLASYLERVRRREEARA